MPWMLAFLLRFVGFLNTSIADHRRSSQVSPERSQQCGQSVTHDGMFEHSPAMFIAAMLIKNIQLTRLPNISLESSLNPHHNAANRLKFG